LEDGRARGRILGSVLVRWEAPRYDTMMLRHEQKSKFSGPVGAVPCRRKSTFRLMIEGGESKANNPLYLLPAPPFLCCRRQECFMSPLSSSSQNGWILAQKCRERVRVVYNQIRQFPKPLLQSHGLMGNSLFTDHPKLPLTSPSYDISFTTEHVPRWF
jgi:hypothetical protein